MTDAELIEKTIHAIRTLEDHGHGRYTSYVECSPLIAAWEERLEELKKAQVEPRTDLGKRLQQIRDEIVASGEPSLDWDGLDEAVKRWRGGE